MSSFVYRGVPQLTYSRLGTSPNWLISKCFQVDHQKATSARKSQDKRWRLEKQISKIVHNGSCAYLYELCPISRCHEHLASFLDKAEHLGALRPEKTPITETYT